MIVKELELLAERNRKRLVEVVYAAKAGHIGGDLSCLNVMTALYFHVMRNLNPAEPKAADRDRFVLSKGHCVEAGEQWRIGPRPEHWCGHGYCCQNGQESVADVRADGRRRTG